MRHELVTVGSRDDGKTLAELHTEKRLFIGTSRDCDVVINREEYPTVSRKHALVVARKEKEVLRLYISDIDSTNGTYINSIRINAEQELREGDIVALGRSAFEFKLAIRGTKEILKADGIEEKPTERIASASRSGLTVLREKRVDKDTSSRAGKNQGEGESEKDDTNCEIQKRDCTSCMDSCTMSKEIPERISSRLNTSSTESIAGKGQNKREESSEDGSDSSMGRIAVISEETHKRILIKEDLTDVKSLAIDSRSGRVVYALAGGELYTKDFDNNRLANRITFSGQDVTAIRFSKDGELIAIARRNKEITIWDINFRNKLQVLSGHKLAISDLSFSPDSRKLASCSLDKTIRCWNIHSAQEIVCSKIKGLGITAIDYSPDESKVLTGGKDRTIGVWNSHTGELEASSKKVSSGIERICCVEDGKHVLLSTSDRFLHQKTIESLDSDIVRLKYAERRVTLSICNSGKYIGCLGPNGQLQIWEISF